MRGLMSRFSFKQSKNFVFPTSCVLTPQNTDVRKLSNERHADGVPFLRPSGAISCRILPSAKQAGQALRRAPHKIPHKSPALPDFYTSASGHVSRAAPAVQGRGGYRPRFPLNRGAYLRGTASPLEAKGLPPKCGGRIRAERTACLDASENAVLRKQ